MYRIPISSRLLPHNVDGTHLDLVRFQHLGLLLLEQNICHRTFEGLLSQYCQSHTVPVA